MALPRICNASRETKRDSDSDQRMRNSHSVTVFSNIKDDDSTEKGQTREEDRNVGIRAQPEPPRIFLFICWQLQISIDPRR